MERQKRKLGLDCAEMKSESSPSPVSLFLSSSPDVKKRLKNEEKFQLSCLPSGEDKDDDLAAISTNGKLSYSASFCSVGAEQWKVAQDRKNEMSSNNFLKGGDDGVDEDPEEVLKGELLTREEDPLLGQDWDDDVNLVLNALMRKVCLESDDSDNSNSCNLLFNPS